MKPSTSRGPILLPLLFAILTAACSRPAETPRAEWFTDVAAATGLDFTQNPGLQGKQYLTEITGSGVALLDFDNDGDLDVYLVQGHPSSGTNRMFENRLKQGGKLRFVDVTEKSGTGFSGVGMGAAAGDYNGDGFMDLYVTNYGRNVLYRNNGNGTFTDVTKDAGVDDDRWSTSSAWFDYDRDGDLDLVVLAYVDFNEKNNKECKTSWGEPDYCAPAAYEPLAARLLRNEGNGKFTDVSGKSGIASAKGPGLGVAVGDYDGDGWLDLYVANDGRPNHLWRNKGNGTFEERGLQAGAAFSEDGVAKAGMGISAGDYDNDGDEDVFVANLMKEGGTLFRNDGKGNFSDVSLQAGLRQKTLPYTGFGLRWFDFDHDGFQDLLVANGAVTKQESKRGQPYPFQQRNLLLRNIAGQGSFGDLSSQAGAALALEEVSRGAAFGDIDGDGDIDVVIANNMGPARLLRNDVAKGNWALITLRQAGANSRAWGAKVSLTSGGKPIQNRRAGADGSYLSSSDDRVHFGWPAESKPDGILVEWPGGEAERFPLTPNQLQTLERGKGAR